MFLTLCLCAYLLGSISVAMLRPAGKRLALLTLFGDLGKGLSPVLLAIWLGMERHEQAWIGFSAVLGHLYPVFFSFRGGKGVATTAGVLLGLYPPAALLALSIWLLAFQISRTSSLASLCALPLTLPLLAWQQPQSLLPASLLTLLLVWSHRNNLSALLTGTERRF